MRAKDYSLFEFRKLPEGEKKRYFESAKKKYAQIVNDVVIELIAANLWAEEKRKKERG
jgi:hypothetical protein